jgi:DNA-binding NtrC family response regulator
MVLMVELDSLARCPHSATHVSKHPLDSLLVCRSAAIEQLRATAVRVAGGEARVLITGESGVGKDVLARFIHAKSRRAAGDFVTVSGAGLEEAALAQAMDEAFDTARGGTLFLDEVSELPLAIQARLLRRIERWQQPEQPREDVRVIASTTRELAELVAHGEFREDLMYRLRVVHLHVPPLRERREDVRPLAEWKARRVNRPLNPTAEAWASLEHYYWPGNVRELSNVIEQVLWTAPQATIGFDDLPETVRGYATGGVKPVQERRRTMADELYSGLVEGRYAFWADVYEMFMRRDITRDDLRGVIRRGLSATRGSYRGMLVLFGLAADDYKRLLNFLNAHDCALDFRDFRNAARALHGRDGRVRRADLDEDGDGSNL